MTVEFRAPADYDHELKGVIALHGDKLFIEFERSRWFRRPEIVEVTVPLDDIDYAEYRGGIFGGKIRMRMLYMGQMESLPWHKTLTIDFVVARKERERALDLVEQIEEEIERAEKEQPSNEEPET